METIEIIDITLSTITAFAIVFAAIQIKINRKQLFLSTITKCISDFRNLGELNKDTNNTGIINRYIDLTNEELFYFQHAYIPRDVSKEWIDGMIDFMPITNKKGIILNQEYVIRYISENRDRVLHNFPRIQNAFEIIGTYDFDAVYSNDFDKIRHRIKERRKLINEILGNVKRFDGFD